MGLHAVVALPLFLLLALSQALRDIVCRDPDAGGTTQNRDRKFILLGADKSEGAGIGNLLIYFPSMYYFAAFTGRDIIVSDNSIIGEMCKIITCGFPFASEMALAFPNILGGDKLRKAETVKKVDFMRYIEGTKEITSDLVYGFGYMSASDWWAYFNTTVHCVKRITGCDIGDIGCADRHAYQRLIRGPFKAALSAQEEKRIRGIPDNMKHAILTLPHSFAPRLDAAVHIRNSFRNFEHQSSVNSPEYRKEVDDWLNSTECQQVFAAYETKLIDQLLESRKEENNTAAAATSNNTPRRKVNDPYYVYLAADNEDVKNAFAEKLAKRQDDSFVLNLMRVESKGIAHVKNLAKMKALTNNEGLMDLVFDWYALSLSNVIIAWRVGHTDTVSTFAQSAQRVSGTTERTRIGSPIGRGIGTRGFQLTKDKRGNQRWSSFWSYGFLEDYRIPGDRRRLLESYMPSSVPFEELHRFMDYNSSFMS